MSTLNTTREYKIVYKCRLCGKTYELGAARVNQIAVISTICSFNYENVVKLSKTDACGIAEIVPHSCEGGNIGIADLCGFREAKEDKE